LSSKDPKATSPVDNLGIAGAALLVGGLIIWYLISRHLAALMLGAGVILIGLEMILKRHSPGGARSVELKGTAAVLAGVALLLVGLMVVGGAVWEWIQPGSMTRYFKR